jgi:uncharacterized membrane protein YqjE
MALSDSLMRLAGNFIGNIVATVHTRLELVSVEVEEELTRFSTYLLWSLVALICGSIAALLAILLLVVLFWDDHRYAVLLSLISLFGISAVVIAWRLRIAIETKPRFLGSTLEELRRDRDNLRQTPHE